MQKTKREQSTKQELLDNTFVWKRLQGFSFVTSSAYAYATN